MGRNFASLYFHMTGDDVHDGMRWWVEWNELALPLVDRAYRIEDFDAALFAELLAMIGLDAPDERARAALAEVPGNVNSAEQRGYSKPELDWAILPRGRDKDRLRRLAERLGYAVD